MGSGGWNIDRGPRVKRLKRVSIGVFPRKMFYVFLFSGKWRNRSNRSKSIIDSRVSVIQYHYFDTFSNVIIEKYGVQSTLKLKKTKTYYTRKKVNRT